MILATQTIAIFPELEKIENFNTQCVAQINCCKTPLKLEVIRHFFSYIYGLVDTCPISQSGLRG